MRLPLSHQFDGLLQSCYGWLQQGTIEFGGSHHRSRIIFCQFLCGIVSVVGGWLAINRSPIWSLAPIFGLTACLLLPTMRLKRFRHAKYCAMLPEPDVRGVEDKSCRERTKQS
jgi:hypothetical protein